MDEILRKINELANFLSQKVRWVEQKEYELLNKGAELDARDNDIRKREQSLLEGESIVALKEKTQANLDEIRNGQIEFEKNRDDFFSRSEKERKEIANIRTKLNQDLEALKNDQEMLKKEWVELDKQKKEYKEEVRSEVLKGLAGKK